MVLGHGGWHARCHAHHGRPRLDLEHLRLRAHPQQRAPAGCAPAGIDRAVPEQRAARRAGNGRCRDQRGQDRRTARAAARCGPRGGAIARVGEHALPGRLCGIRSRARCAARAVRAGRARTAQRQRAHRRRHHDVQGGRRRLGGHADRRCRARTNAHHHGSEDALGRPVARAAARGCGWPGEGFEMSEEQAAPGDAKATVRKGGRVVVIVIAISLVLYLFADRYTPYTSQARIEGFVVGVAPKVAGAVTKISVANNQTVKAGQPLLEIDPAQYRIALAKAQSDLANAHKQVGAGSATVEASRAKLLAARAAELAARQDAMRLRRLREEDEGTVSVRRQEIADAGLQQATAQVAAAEADIRRAIEQMGGDDVDENTVLQTALTAVDKAQLDLANTVVTAPAAGVITDLRTDVGLYAGTGSPVLTLVAIRDVWINAEFTENNLGHMQVGTPVDIVFDALPGRVFKGRVRSIGLGVSAGSAPPPGTLPSIDNSRDWLRQSQRFPVIVGFDARQDPALHDALRVGGQASVIAYGEGSGLLRLLGKLYIRAASLLSYAY